MSTSARLLRHAQRALVHCVDARRRFSFNPRAGALASALLLACATAFAPTPAQAQTKAQVVTASQKGVNYILNYTKTWAAGNGNCFSCHMSGPALAAGALAEKSPDLTVDQVELNRLVSSVNAQQYDGAGTYNGAISHDGTNSYFSGYYFYTTSSLALEALAAIDRPTTATPFSSARFIKGAGFIERSVPANGLYPSDYEAPPIQTGNPSETGRAIRVMAAAYAIDGAAHWNTSIAKAVTYLRAYTPRNQGYGYYIQDVAWVINGLVAAGVPTTDAKIVANVALIKGRQNADGGWSLDATASGFGSGSDSMATGFLVSTLKTAGDTSSTPFINGVKWLLNHQNADGSWPSPPSIGTPVTASAWAVLALTEIAAATPPVITSALTATGTYGSPFSYTITASNTPTSFSATGFPAGLAITSSSGLLSGTPTATGSFSVALGATNSGGTGTATLALTINKAASSITLGNLAQTFDGTQKIVTATTSPSGLSVSLMYNGSSTAPTNVGSYPILASISNANYSGSASGTLVISPAAATITLGNLTQPYDGSAKSVSVTTAPAGVATTVTYNGSATAPTAVGTYSVAAAVANANYTGTASATLQITDTIPPVLSLPANLTLEATSAAGAVATFSATANDNVDGAVAVTLTPASGSTFPIGVTTVTATATDAVGNTATGTFTVTVNDSTPPVITAPSDIVTEATSAAGAVVTFTFSAVDLVDSAVSVSSSPASGSTFPLGSTLVTVTATDSHGNSAVKTFAVIVHDSTAPVIAAQQNLIIEATSAAGAAVAFTPSALDLVDSAVNVTTSVASGSTFALGTTPVLITATDAAHNSSTSSFDVTVVDTTAPVIATPAAITAEATSAAGALVTFNLTASDLVDGAVTVTASPASGSVFPIGTTTVTLTATDAAGNPANSSFSVTVADTTAPVLTTPASQTLEATSAAGAVATFSATATDAVGATVSTTAASGSTFPLGVTTVNVTAVDAAGNHSDGSFTITVVDQTAPVIAVPGNIVLEATSAAGAVASFTTSATDLVSGDVPVSSSIASGSTFALGTTAVTLTATDAAGNTATAVFSVTVSDQTAPVIAAQDNLTVEATGPTGAVVTFTPSASDIVSGAVSVTASPASGSTFALGTTTVTLTTHDAAGNSATSTFTVTVRDQTAPVIAAQPNLTAEATSAAGAAVSFTPSASDLVDGAVSVTTSAASGSVFPIGTTTVTLTATDAAGNTSSSSFTVTVADTIAPVLTTPASQTLEAASAAGTAATFTASATDAVGATLAYSVASGSTFAIGTTTVTVTATDAAGHVTSGSFTITVADTIAPVLTVPANLIVEATSAAGAAVTYTASATDAVGATLSFSKASGTVFALGTTTVTVTASDAAGHVTTKTFTVTVRDTVGPVLTYANIVVEATDDEGNRVNFTVSATDLVSGARPVTVSRPSGSRFPIGVTTVVVTSRDALGNLSTGSFTVTVRDTTAPVLRLPANITAKAKSAAGAKVEFRATASDLIDERVKITYSQAPGSTFPLGTTVVTVTATDDYGNVSTGTFTVTVVDKTKPEFTKLSVNPSVLLNGSHQMVAVTVTALAKDAVDSSLNVRIVSVTSDEAITGTGPGDVGPDWQITGPLTLNLRNELDPKSNGRIYTIAVAATDDAGNTRTRTLHVFVPKKSSSHFEDCDRDHRSDGRRCDDEGRDYDRRDQGDDDDND